MSLTAHIRRPDSPIRAYIKQAFPILEQSKRGLPFAKQFSTLLGFDALPRCSLPTLSPQSHQGTIGTAVDYRLRYYFEPYDTHQTVAKNGVRMLDGKLHTLGIKFLDYQNTLIRRLKPSAQQLNDDDEAALNTSCIVLAFFEQVYRTGKVNPPLDSLSRRAKLSDLLTLVHAEMVDDVSQLSCAFAIDASELRNGKAVLNPNFQGSGGIGGADADIIVDRTLIEFKCTPKVDAGKLREATFQLLGYVLLDYDGEYAISDLMVYLPRQRASWRVPLWQLLLPPADVILQTTDRAPQNVEALVEGRLSNRRKEFRSIVESLS